MNLTLFFTRGVSLRVWLDTGLMERESAIYERLAARGACVSFITYGANDGPEFAECLRNFRILRNRWRLPQGLYARLLPWLHADTLRNADVLKSNQVAGAEVALAAARRHGKKFIARCGYLPSFFARHAHGEGAKEVREARALEARVFKGADRVVVTTDAMRRTIVDEYGVRAEHVRVIPNYVDTELFSAEEKSRHPRRLCFVGRLVEQKNLFALLEAIRNMDVELCIVGDGHLRAGLESAARRHGLAVRFAGNLPHRLLPSVLNEASAFVLPSLYEGHPKALLEAMSCGLPVIGSNVPGIREAIDHKKTGYLCDPSPSGLREAISTLLNDRELCRKIGQAARQTIIERCSLERAAAAEFALIEELANP